MWPFSRKPETTSTPEPAPVTPQVHFDWKGLAAIQRTIADHPLTVPTESFASHLATQEDPRAVAKPLGHQVSLEAPPGIVLGIARTEPRRDGPALIPLARPVKRASALQLVIDESVAGEAGMPDVERTEEEQAIPPVAPIRQLAASSEPVPSVQLTRVTAETAPTPLAPELVTRSEEPAAPATDFEPSMEATTTEVPSYPRLTLGQARRLGLGAPISRVPETATSIQRVSEVSVHPAPAAHQASRSIEQEAPMLQTFELDYLVNKKPEVVAPAPISRPQRIPLPVSRSEAPEPAPEPTPSPDAAVEPSTTAETSSAAAEQAPAAVQRTAEPEAADELPVQTSPAVLDEAPTRKIAGPHAITAATDPRRMLLTDAPQGEADRGEGEAAPTLPLAFATSAELSAAMTYTDVTPTPAVARFADEEARALSSTTPAAPEPIKEGHTLAPLVSVRPHLLTHPAPPMVTSVQRVAGESPSTDRTAARVVPVDAVTQPAEPVFTAKAPSFAIPSLPEGTVAPALPLAQEPRHVYATPILQRTTSMPPAFAPVSSPSVQTSTPVLERAVDDAVFAPPFMQRSAVQEWTVSASAAESSGTSLVQAGEAQPGTPGGNDDEQMEHLAAKLYDKIRGRLRNELLVDRERAGFLTDLR